MGMPPSPFSFFPFLFPLLSCADHTQNFLRRCHTKLLLLQHLDFALNKLEKTLKIVQSKNNVIKKSKTHAVCVVTAA